MFRQLVIPAAAAICAAASVIAPAHAQEQFAVSFSFAADANAQDVYADFRQTARQACAADLRRSGGVTIQVARVYRSRCNADLVAKAVAAVGDPQLAALHRTYTSEAPGQLLARAE